MLLFVGVISDNDNEIYDGNDDDDNCNCNDDTNFAVVFVVVFIIVVIVVFVSVRGKESIEGGVRAPPKKKQQSQKCDVSSSQT